MMFVDYKSYCIISLSACQIFSKSSNFKEKSVLQSPHHVSLIVAPNENTPARVL